MMNALIKTGLLGFGVAALALWGGAFVVNALPGSHWAEIPTAITCIVIFVFGLILGTACVIEGVARQ